MPSSDFTPNNVWADSSPAGTEEEITLPSGQTCRARKMSIESMIEAGMLAQADALTAQVQKHTKKIKTKVGGQTGRGGKQAPPAQASADVLDEQALMKDPSGMKALVSLMDRALPHIVTSPTVVLHFTETTVGKTTVTKVIPAEDRESGLVYTDQIGFEDKVDLFNWAADGLGSMLTFRQ